LYSDNENTIEEEENQKMQFPGKNSKKCVLPKTTFFPLLKFAHGFVGPILLMRCKIVLSWIS